MTLLSYTKLCNYCMPFLANLFCHVKSEFSQSTALPNIVTGLKEAVRTLRLREEAGRQPFTAGSAGKGNTGNSNCKYKLNFNYCYIIFGLYNQNIII